jgi:hypothetical protein
MITVIETRERVKLDEINPFYKLKKTGMEWGI